MHIPGVQKPHCEAWNPANLLWIGWKPLSVFPSPSDVVMEHSFTLQRRVRQEFIEYSSTLSDTGSYFDRITMQAPQPPARKI